MRPSATSTLRRRLSGSIRSAGWLLIETVWQAAVHSVSSTWGRPAPVRSETHMTRCIHCIASCTGWRTRMVSSATSRELPPCPDQLVIEAIAADLERLVDDHRVNLACDDGVC